MYDYGSEKHIAGNCCCCIANHFSGVETADIGIYFLDDISDLLVCAKGRLLEMENETINFVDDENWLHSLLEGLLQHSKRLRAYAFDHIHNHKAAITESHLNVIDRKCK